MFYSKQICFLIKTKDTIILPILVREDINNMNYGLKDEIHSTVNLT